MGTWTCQRVKHSTSDITGENFSTTFQVRFRMKYSRSRFGSFSEMPTLEWKETILLMDYAEGTYWKFADDQYKRLPGGGTMRTWRERYVLAYNSVWYQDPPTAQVVLFDHKGRRLDKTFFGKKMIPKAGPKAIAVREYLKRSGGIMEIEIIDKPGFQKPKPGAVVRKERLLTFDCGLRGKGNRVKAYQHIKVDSAQPENQWTREVVYNTKAPSFDLKGLKKINPPPNVTRVEHLGVNVATGCYP